MRGILKFLNSMNQDRARRSMLVTGLAVAFAAGIAGSAATATAAEEVNLYSYRQEFLIRPLLDAFTKETGIAVNVQYVKGGILKRMQEEGDASVADLVLAADIATLSQHVEADTFQPVDSAALKANIPAQFRDPEGRWFGLTTRARVIVYSKDRINPSEIGTYEDLTDPKWAGRICTRSSGHVYMKSLLASIIVAKGEEIAQGWAKGVNDNLARKPQGNDRAQVKAIWQGECDIALINTYYLGAMQFNEAEPEQKEWVASIGVIFPNRDDRGTHINISGGGVAKHAKNRDNAVKLLEFLSDARAQEYYAGSNFEYPVKAGVKWHPAVEAWGRFHADEAPLFEIAKQVPLAIKLYDRAGYR
ncbi:MAG: Fe(3+) ABC transporter substrate-binding protein [Alphaproteobacteria bacterium]|nr:Fe(3+) ABC transporter substrate-binding protein [Alphaproteobacteria bacterium]